MNQSTREELFELYTDFCEKYNQLQDLMREVGGTEYERAKAYWLGSIESGIRCEEYVGNNPTFRSFLEGAGVIDEDEEFIEKPD